MPSYYVSEDLARFGEMAKTNPKLFDLFMKWYGATMEKGALDEKTKKLIALAVAYAIQEPYCIDSYASACTDAGHSPEEMAEAVNVAAVIRGGGVIAHWVQACNTMVAEGMSRLVVIGAGPMGLEAALGPGSAASRSRCSRRAESGSRSVAGEARASSARSG